MLNSLTQMVLVNAIYFKGNWQTPFDPEDTKPGDFYVTKDEKITVNMMFQEGSFYYAENPALQMKALELKYQDEDYSLLIVLPTSEDDYSLESLVDKIQDPNIFNGIINDLVLDGVEVHLPSIETTTTTDLKQILQGVNVTEIFNPDTTDISGILEYLQPLYVTVAVQKAVLVINESGTEVSVANAVITGLRMGFVGNGASSDFASFSSSASNSYSQSSSYVSSDTYGEDTPENVCDEPHEYYETCESSAEAADDLCVVGCRCESNYVRNDKGKCIAKNKFCRRQFETFTDCVNGGCDRRNCSELKRPAICIDVVRNSCIQGCVCKKNYLRNVHGYCVPVNNCPERKDPKCRGVNEYYENCASASNCETCGKGCHCVLGYVRNDEGQCEVDKGQYYVPTTVTPAPAEVDADKALEKILDANTHFTQSFLQFKTNENPEDSFIASPFSVLIPLAEIVLYTIGKSFAQITSVLNVTNKDEIRQGMRRLLDNFKLPKNVTLNLAQKIYANKQFELSDAFKHDTEVYFDAEAENLDFSQRASAAKTINDWVKAQTNGLIPNLVDESLLSELTRLVLVNAIYFKGNWFRPFDPKNTKKKEFFMTKDKNGTVDMMYQKGYFRYMESPTLEIKALELLYKDRNYSLLCVLPTSTDTYSLEGLAQKLQDPQTFKSIIDGLQNQEVNVYLPSIQTSTTTDLTKVFKAVNITEVLNPNNTDMVGILKVFQQLYVSAAVQKAKVVINELGSEAAAANAVVITTKALPLPKPEPKLFEANRPYIYFIKDQKNILFCGGFTGT
ncbi:Alaserpin [Papilio machaon]|uniref:Alaserpin n=1 Tax=Papilio machaon TaxID=76193 RepID=A0A194R0R3_PAPMA|nr:Alaserpin [Papilio machaon]